MKYLLFPFIFLTTGCLVPIPIPGYIPQVYEQPIYENLDEVAVVLVYAPNSSAYGVEGYEILIDGKLSYELENGEVKVTVAPGNHTVALGTYLPNHLIVSHIEVIKLVEKYFYPGETYYIRLKRSPKWSGRLSYSDIQLTNKQMYDVEFALFRGLITYDALQKAYVEESCKLDTAKIQNTKINTQLDLCGSAPSFDFYVQALEEVDTNSFEWDVWDKALNEVRGDQNKQMAKYIELRADQLYAEKAGEISATSLYKQAIPKTDSGRLSGTYHSSITSNKTIKNPPVVFLTQSGNKVTGVFYPDKGERINGTIDGNSIKIRWTQPEASYDRKSSWNISSDGTKLEGRWYALGGASDEGKWVLTNVGSVSAASLNKQEMFNNYLVELSGTYHSLLISNKGDKSRPVVILTQSGNKISGAFYPDNGDWINGTRNGNTIKFRWISASGSYDRTGTWKIEIIDGRTILKGTWANFGNTTGEWNLTNIE